MSVPVCFQFRQQKTEIFEGLKNCCLFMRNSEHPSGNLKLSWYNGISETSGGQMTTARTVHSSECSVEVL